MSTAALCRKVNKADPFPDPALVIAVSSPRCLGQTSSSSLALLLLCMGSVTAAICSHSIKAEIRGVEGHMSGGQSGDTAFESLSPQKSLLHQTAGGLEGEKKSMLMLRVAEKTES